MNRAAAFILLLIASSFGFGERFAVAQEQAPSASGQPASILPVELAKSLDSRKLKQGDPVEGRVIDQWRAADGTLVPPGSKVMGHVTDASARAKGGSQSQLGLVFDQIAMKNGHTVALKATIQAVGPPMNYGSASMPMGGPAGSPGVGPMGGVTPGGNPVGVGGVTNPTSTIPNPAGSGGNGPDSSNQQKSQQISPQSTGVVGLQGLQLEQGSVLASDGKQVKLQAGSQILLRVQDQ